MIQFPQAPAKARRADRLRAIEGCLGYLQEDARALGLPMLDLLIGMAREAALDEIAEMPAEQSAG